MSRYLLIRMNLAALYSNLFPQVNQFEESASVVFAPIIINQPTELSKSPINMFVHKSRWTAAEDDKLTDAVRRFGAKNWGKIAEYVGTRTGKQCRERWIIHHDPSYSHDVWTQRKIRSS
ncbi:RNA polymerase II transcription regulator recruiting protein [Trichomonas vaginalis G3]|uniref:RNA polymerase II transcription regulator recruiting protein n=1 Tax=Trichomonas vaginalis (strain ATCC PRA-98 / G3) TaxID=412133 RepID=UPI0021E588D5|nr:RNA polymerase II transcription regulator recruiting protein [Trichomonas vaginalis G3]KAI5525371.1 RNA polymerase II transcription regulator recruiting protein [Trichomonas vaginalis G3]